MNYFFSRDWSAAVTLPIFFLRFQQARPSGCGFSLSRLMEGMLLPSEKAANGGVIFDKKDDFCSRPLFFSSSVEPE